MERIELEHLTQDAVMAAIKVIDKAMHRTTSRRGGPCGDKLATQLHATILEAVTEHAKSDMAPWHITFVLGGEPVSESR